MFGDYRCRRRLLPPLDGDFDTASREADIDMAVLRVLGYRNTAPVYCFGRGARVQREVDAASRLISAVRLTLMEEKILGGCAIYIVYDDDAETVRRAVVRELAAIREERGE